MGIVRANLYVVGMTCPACETRISKALYAVDGVAKAEVRLRGGRAQIEFDDAIVAEGALKRAIEAAGYGVRERGGAGTAVALGIGVLLVALYLLAASMGAFSSLPKVDASVSYAALLVVGLLTSIHCVAMCGGIALSQSLGRAGTGSAAVSGAARLVPGLLYNAGRIFSYTGIGAAAGALGSAFNFSPAVRGAITAAAGLFMVLLALRMLGVIEGLPRSSNTALARLRRYFARFTAGLRSRGPFIVGVLNGLMPCGPLQTMQLYALGTGSALAGAFSMAVFSAGTVPLLLAFGTSAALLPRRFVPVMVKASGILVMFLGVATMTRAAALSGVALPDLSLSAVQRQPARSASASPVSGRSPARSPLTARIEDGVQTVTTDFTGDSYVPFAVQAGVPLKWTIRVREEDLNGCNNPVEIPGYGIRKTLRPGENLIEFTPEKEGVIPYSCWMGMIRSRITVVKDLAAAQVVAPGAGNADAPAELPDPRTGGSCCSLGRVSSPVTIGMPVVVDGIQVVTITVGSEGYTPSAVVLQKGMKAVFKFKVEEITSCNSPVVFPEYNGALDFAKGQLETPPIPVSADFTFRCWMGMLRGYVKAVDDLSTVDTAKALDEIRTEQASLGSGPSAGACCGSGTSAD